MDGKVTSLPLKDLNIASEEPSPNQSPRADTGNENHKRITVHYGQSTQIIRFNDNSSARNISKAIQLAFGISGSSSICLRNKQNDVVVIDPSMSQNEEYVLTLIAKTPKLEFPSQIGGDTEGGESSSDSESLGPDSPPALSPRSPRMPDLTKPTGVKKRRQRRKASEIDKVFKCPAPGCTKAYGSDNALKTHVKLKHPGADIRKDLSPRLNTSESQVQITSPRKEQYGVRVPNNFPHYINPYLQPSRPNLPPQLLASATFLAPNGFTTAQQLQNTGNQLPFPAIPKSTSFSSLRNRAASISEELHQSIPLLTPEPTPQTQPNHQKTTLQKSFSTNSISSTPLFSMPFSNMERDKSFGQPLDPSSRQLPLPIPSNRTPKTVTFNQSRLEMMEQ